LPQIWMTCEELAGMLECSVLEARERIQLEHLDRKISRDGKTRVKLSAELTVTFVERLRSIDLVTDRAVEELRHVHGLLERAEQLRRLPSWLGLRKAG
jgi:hypothetical protein